MRNKMEKLRPEISEKHPNIYVYTDWAFLILLVPTAVFLFWKCRYGFANLDESFYLTIPLRLLQGDALLWHEWNLTQLSSVLLLPFVAAYRLFSADNVGMQLSFRYLFSAVQLLAAMFVYLRLRKTSPAAALMAALGFAVFAPFGIMALSYNSMGIIAMVLCTVIWLTAEKHRGAQLFAAGLLFACAVLCCPYLAIGYVLLSAVCLVRFCRKEKAEFNDWLWITAGVVFSALLFSAFLLSRASLGQIFSALPHIMNDSEHPYRSLPYVVWTYFTALFTCNGKWSALCMGGYLLLLLLAVADRKRKFSAMLFLAGGFLTAIYAFSFLRHCRHLNFQMFPLNMFALLCWALSDDKSLNRLMGRIWLPGMLYSFCIHYASNQEFAAISSASTVAFIGSVPVIVLYAQRLRAEEKSSLIRSLVLLGSRLLMIFQLGAEYALRYDTVFWERGMAAQCAEISHGPEKGLLVSEEKQALYDKLMLSLHDIPEYRQARSVAFVSDKTWLYLAGDKEYATYSAWLGGISESSVQRLADYFRLIPEKTPDVILLEPEYEQYASVLALAEEFELKRSGPWVMLCGR